ncbi:hypothetical protein B0H19DRAFT_1183835 [Mycena capillaripes]|nr:hypothetical protein B0H19DRAFT_1183835 [Mycena capillaripes]
MRPSAIAPFVLLAVSQCTHAASLGYGRRQDGDCPSADLDGTELTDSAPSGDVQTCTYDGGAGVCAYAFEDGSLTSGSDKCPQNDQDPSETTDAPSSSGAAPTSTVGDDSTSESDNDTDSESATNSVSSKPAVSTPLLPSSPIVSKPAISTPPPTASKTGSSASPSASPSGNPGGARALSVSLTAVVGAVGLGMLL